MRARDFLLWLCRLLGIIVNPSKSSSSAPSSAAGPASSSAPFSSRAHSVRGVAASWAFARNAPLSSVLAAASWSSSSVFTSFYLSDVQFSSSHGFSLGWFCGVGVFSCLCPFVPLLSLLLQLGVCALRG